MHTAGRIPLAALAAAFLLAACTAEKREATPDTVRVAGSPRPGPRDTAAVFAPVSDADARMLIALTNASEIGAGATAARKATDPRVRTFASDMIADHTALQQTVGTDTTAGAGTTSAGIARADTLRRVSKRQSDSLAALPRGAAFDRTYIDQQISAHSMALDSLQRWRTDVRALALRAVLDSAVPKVASHLDRAKAVQATLGGMYRALPRVRSDTLGTRPDTAVRPRVEPDSSRR